MSAVASLEWRLALARRRVFALNVLIPLLLVAPLALGGAPPHHAAAVYAVLFVLFGTFGAAIPMVRDADRGLVGRVALTGLPPRALIGGRLAAQTALDTLQLLPAIALVLIAESPTAGVAAVLPVLLFTALVAANALGLFLAALARSIAEAALFCAVGALLALHVSGVFRTPAPGSPAAALERLVPFRYLHEALQAAVGVPGAEAGALALLPATVGAVAAAFLLVLAAPLLLRSVAHGRR